MAASSLILVVGELNLVWMAASMVPSASPPGSGTIHHALGARDLESRRLPAFHPNEASTSLIIRTWLEVGRLEVGLEALVPVKGWTRCGLPVDPVCVGEETVLGDYSRLEPVRGIQVRGWSQKLGSNRRVVWTRSLASAKVHAPTVSSTLKPPISPGSTV